MEMEMEMNEPINCLLATRVYALLLLFSHHNKSSICYDNLDIDLN